MVETNQTPQPAENPSSSNSGDQNANAKQPEDVQQSSEQVNRDACMWAMFCHLAGLCVFVLPVVGNIVGPLVIWQLKKDEHPFVDQQGKEALNFQISIMIYSLVSAVLTFICVGFFLLAAVGVIDLVFLLIAAVKANNGQSYRYPLTIRFIK